MKEIARVILPLVAALALAVNVWATPVTFTTDFSESSVTVTDNACFAKITGTLMSDDITFNVADGNTQALDFFTLKATGLTLGSTYDVEATLAFSTPPIQSEGEGGGCFATIFGKISGGTLTWKPESLPDYFSYNGNKIMIDFEDGFTVILGSTVMVHAYVTNLGTATSVPEPLTIFLLGTGLIGLGFCSRCRMKK